MEKKNILATKLNSFEFNEADQLVKRQIQLSIVCVAREDSVGVNVKPYWI